MSGFGSIRFRVTAVAVATSTAFVVAFGWLLIELVTDRLVAAGEDELTQLTEEVDGFSLVDLGESGARYQIAGGDYLLLLDLNDDGDLFVDVHAGDDPEGDSIGAFIIDTGTGKLREVIVESDELARAELEQLGIEGAARIQEVSDDLALRREGLVQSTEDVFDGISDGVQAARSAAFVVGPLFVLVSGLTTWLLVGRALAPTRRIAQEAAAIGTATLDRRVSRRGPNDEVDTIARVINDMLDRIESGVRREQQFVADASHELKTPLATARMAAELAAADTPDSPYPSQLVEEVDRMQRLVDDLLRLARGGEVEPDDEVAFDALVAEAVDQHPAADRIRMVAMPNVPVTVRGSGAELGRTTRNLLDNAVRHAASRVEVSLLIESGRADRDGADHAVLVVDDDGPGIPEADRSRVFDRFVRLDEGRARDDGGSGLGLSIVSAAMVRHGGTVSVSRSPLGGARFEIRLPAASGVDPPE